MKELSIFLLALFLLVGCSSNEAFENAMGKGKEAVISKEYERALASFELALEEKNDDKEAKVFVAQTEKMVEAIELQENEEYDDALALFAEVEAMDGGYERLSKQAREQREELVILMDEKEVGEVAKQEVDKGESTEEKVVQVAEETPGGETITNETTEEDFQEKYSGTFVDTNGEVVIVLEITSDNILYGSFSLVDSDSETPISFVTPVTSKGSTDIFELYVDAELTEGGMSINFEGSKITLTAMSGISYQEVYEFSL